MTTERPTPEVDAAEKEFARWLSEAIHTGLRTGLLPAEGIGKRPPDGWEVSRRLERERDEAREHEGYVPESELDEARTFAEEACRRYNESLRVVTCVYCGAPYPPATPMSGAQILKDHIEVCEKHPLHEAIKRAEAAEALLRECDRAISQFMNHSEGDELHERIRAYVAHYQVTATIGNDKAEGGCGGFVVAGTVCGHGGAGGTSHNASSKTYPEGGDEEALQRKYPDGKGKP